MENDQKLTVKIKNTRDSASPALHGLCKCKKKPKSCLWLQKTEAKLKYSVIYQHCSGQTCDNVPNLRDGNKEENEANDEEFQIGIDALIFCKLVLREQRKTLQ